MKDFTNERKKANRAVVFSCRPFPNILKYKDQFHQKLIDRQTEYELIVPNFLFAEPNKFILVKIPFSISNENTVKRFLDKLQSFAYHKFDIAVKWFTNKIRSLFCLQDKNMHLTCKIYEICSYSANHTGKTKQNVETRWNKHENPNKDSEPAKHLREIPDHKFDWKIRFTAPTNAKLHKILESSMIALKQPSLNKQLDFDLLILFRNGVT